MRRAVAIAAIIGWVFALFLLLPDIKNIFLTHPLWHSLLAAVPGIAVPVLAWFELRHSSEANALRADANRLRSEQNDLQNQIGELTAELAAERNKHLQQIAENTKKPVTQAEKKADVLRKYLGANVAVSEGQGSWPTAPGIVGVSDDNIVSLFTPRSPTSSHAFLVNVHCDDLEITEIPQGNCPIRIKVLKRRGVDVQLGEITKWEDRNQPAASPIFTKGGMAYHATYSKPGSSERRTIYVYAAKDGSNSFLLEASTGQRVIGNNEEISKRFSVLQIEYEAGGFERTNSGTGGSLHRLFIR